MWTWWVGHYLAAAVFRESQRDIARIADVKKKLHQKKFQCQHFISQKTNRFAHGQLAEVGPRILMVSSLRMGIWVLLRCWTNCWLIFWEIKLRVCIAEDSGTCVVFCKLQATVLEFLVLWYSAWVAGFGGRTQYIQDSSTLVDRTKF